jgi:NAD(P)-dependent dehydrogenase (short-subunit alcohol dehydrogenase family)
MYVFGEKPPFLFLKNFLAKTNVAGSPGIIWIEYLLTTPSLRVFTAGDRLATIPIQDANYENILRAGQVRFIAPLLVAKIGSRYLNKGPESSIILTAGIVAEKPIPGWSVVASYAAGLHGMVRNLAVDLKPVRVNLVSPGPVDTELWKGMGDGAKKNMFKEIEGRVPTGHVGRRKLI